MLRSILYDAVKQRQVLPASLVIDGVRRTTKDPIKGGGMADIYQGELNDKTVALKVLRYFEIDEGAYRVCRVLK